MTPGKYVCQLEKIPEATSWSGYPVLWLRVEWILILSWPHVFISGDDILREVNSRDIAKCRYAVNEWEYKHNPLDTYLSCLLKGKNINDVIYALHFLLEDSSTKYVFSEN